MGMELIGRHRTAQELRVVPNDPPAVDDLLDGDLDAVLVARCAAAGRAILLAIVRRDGWAGTSVVGC